MNAGAPTSILNIRSEIFPWPSEFPQSISVPTHPLAQLNGYRVEFFGAFFPSGIEMDHGRVWEIALPEEIDPVRTLQTESPDRWRQGACFRTWRQRAYLAHSDLYTELRWPHEVEGTRREPYVRFGGLEHPHGQRELKALNRAIELLRRIPRKWAGGRPRGSKKGLRWSRRDFLIWYREATEGYANDGELPTLGDLASALGVKSEDTAKARTREARLSWPPTPDELAELDEE